MRILGLRRGRRFHGGFARATDRLFFPVLPDADARARIVERRERLRAAHGLKGRLLLPEHLHVTLFHVGDSAEAPHEGVIEALTERARSIVMPRFKVAFDRARSFTGGAYVLTSDEGTIGLDVLHQRLTDAFLRRPRPATAYTPHVTMLRDPRVVPGRASSRSPGPRARSCWCTASSDARATITSRTFRSLKPPASGSVARRPTTSRPAVPRRAG